MTQSKHTPGTTRAERRRVAEILRTESTGGLLLVTAAVIALVLANSPWSDAYFAVRDWRVGPAALDLHLTIGQWTADGLLAIFFFLAGLELKREFVAGDLRDPRRAAVPVLAAVGGMAAPAGIYLAITAGDASASAGWAVPTATDIAFALAVLAIVGSNLPPALRTFLLTLAVVDDLLAIAVIAVAYTDALQWRDLGAALACWAIFTVAMQRLPSVVRRGQAGGRVRYAGLVTLAVVAASASWVLMHSSGVHATVAGVLLGFSIPVLGRRVVRGRPRGAAGPRQRNSAAPGPRPEREPGAGMHRGEPPAVARRLEHALRPISAGVAVPVFAFFAAGVPIGGLGGLAHTLGNPVPLGVIAGLLLGKTVGILGTTLTVGAVIRSPLLRQVRLMDLVGLSVLGGVGFTVSLLIGELAFGPDQALGDQVRLGVLCGSVLAAVVGGAILAVRSRGYRNRG